LTIDAEVELYFFGKLKIASGHILADVSDIHSNLDIGFSTQPASHDERTGMTEGSEMAPAVTFNVLALDIDIAKSDIKIKGFFLSFFADLILKEFKTQIFAKIIDQTQTFIETTLEDDANSYLFEHGSHYYVDGLGFDFSQTRQPSVTDNSLLTFFMKGTFYGENAAHVNSIQHTKFEVGQEGVQDLMLHVSDSVFQSFFTTVIANGEFPVSKYMKDSFFSHQYNYGDNFICKLDQTVCHSKPAGTPIDFTVKFPENLQFALSENKVFFNSTVEFLMNDIDGTLITDFELDNINVDLNLWSDPLYAKINGNFNNFRFYGAKVVKQGSLYVDPRELRKDDSESFGDIQNKI
jgi:hypothetical protein